MPWIVEMAKAGGSLPPYEAMLVVVAMIDRLNIYSDTYELDVTALMRVGATIWTLAGGSGGAYDPT